MSSEKRPFNPENDADIGWLLYKTAQALKQFALRLGSFFLIIWNTITLIIVFIIRNIFWLIAGAVVGLGFGYYKFSRGGTQYTSTMTVKANFGSAATLYNTVEYINTLISSGRNTELAQLFKVTEQEAQQLSGISATPIKSEQIEAQMYRDELMKFNRALRSEQETYWVSSFTYNEFKKSRTRENYPFHEINVLSRDPALYSKLKQGFIDYISSNTLLRELKEENAARNKEEEKVLASAIENLDSLRVAYNKNIEKRQSQITSPNLLLLPEEKPVNLPIPELEVYDKMLQIQDKLTNLRKSATEENNIIDIYADFSPVGKPLKFMRKDGYDNAATGFLTALFILLFIAIYKAAIKYYKEKKRPAVNASN